MLRITVWARESVQIVLLERLLGKGWAERSVLKRLSRKAVSQSNVVGHEGAGCSRTRE